MTPHGLLEHLDSGRLWPWDMVKPAWADVASAYQDALRVRRLRLARGERPAGYRLGFTNTADWPRLAVTAPIFGTVWDSTIRFCDDRGAFGVDDICQPRIETGVVFGLGTTPPEGADLEQLFGCLAWVAPYLEVVQCHCPDWALTAPEAVADGALHACLLVGRQHPVHPMAQSGAELDALLAGTSASLFCADELRDQGSGASALSGPLSALHHFTRELQSCPGAPRLQAGDLVATGSWIEALPAEEGESWRVEFAGALGTLTLDLTGRW
jgi:2-oxo-3-hexenedioate decarboxylase